MKTKTILKATLMAGAVAVAVAAASAAKATEVDMEKCFGVVKAGKNDCKAASGAFSCQGHSMKDGDKEAFVLLPKGTCDKLTGGVKG